MLDLEKRDEPDRPGQRRKTRTWWHPLLVSVVAYQRREEQIAEEAALDGLNVVRTSLTKQTFSAEQAVAAYKDLSKVERAFRSMRSVDWSVRSIAKRQNGVCWPTSSNPSP